MVFLHVSWIMQHFKPWLIFLIALPFSFSQLADGMQQIRRCHISCVYAACEQMVLQPACLSLLIHTQLEKGAIIKTCSFFFFFLFLSRLCGINPDGNWWQEMDSMSQFPQCQTFCSFEGGLKILLHMTGRCLPSTKLDWTFLSGSVDCFCVFPCQCYLGWTYNEFRRKSIILLRRWMMISN